MPKRPRKTKRHYLGANGLTAEDQGKLRAYAERIIRLRHEQEVLAEDIKAVLGEADAAGFKKAMLRKVVAEKMAADKPIDARLRLEVDAAMLDTFRHALGLLTDTPLGQAALKAESRRDAPAPQPAPPAAAPPPAPAAAPERAPEITVKPGLGDPGEIPGFLDRRKKRKSTITTGDPPPLADQPATDTPLPEPAAVSVSGQPITEAPFEEGP